VYASRRMRRQPAAGPRLMSVPSSSVVIRPVPLQVLTLFVACGLGALFTALGVNSPERRAVNAQLEFRDQYNATNTAILEQLYAAAAGPANAAVVTTLNVRDHMRAPCASGN
jgi:hypothetical protein